MGSDPFLPGSSAKLNLKYYGREYQATQAVSKLFPPEGSSTNVQLLIRASVPGVRIPIRIEVTLPAEAFALGGAVLPASVSGSVFAGTSGDSSSRYLGDFQEPIITLEKANLREGALMHGRITSDLLALPWEDFDLRVFNPVKTELQK